MTTTITNTTIVAIVTATTYCDSNVGSSCQSSSDSSRRNCNCNANNGSGNCNINSNVGISSKTQYNLSLPRRNTNTIADYNTIITNSHQC